MRLHISLNTTHSECKPSSSISSFTHSLQAFLPLLENRKIFIRKLFSLEPPDYVLTTPLVYSGDHVVNKVSPFIFLGLVTG